MISNHSYLQKKSTTKTIHLKAFQNLQNRTPKLVYNTPGMQSSISLYKQMNQKQFFDFFFVLKGTFIIYVQSSATM